MQQHINRYSPNTILADIKRGQIPSDWHVVQGQPVTSLTSGILTALGVFLITQGLLGMLFVVVIDPIWHISALPNFSQYFWQILIQSWVQFLMNGVFFPWWQATTVRKTLLVLSPEGFFHFRNVTTSSKKHVCTMHMYADIARIEVKQRKMSEKLKLYYRSGGCATWTCLPWYGPVEKVAQDIMDAHTQYISQNSYHNPVRYHL